jgi:hypothetical protein
MAKSTNIVSVLAVGALRGTLSNVGKFNSPTCRKLNELYGVVRKPVHTSWHHFSKACNAAADMRTHPTYGRQRWVPTAVHVLSLCHSTKKSKTCYFHIHDVFVAHRDERHQPECSSVVGNGRHVVDACSTTASADLHTTIISSANIYGMTPEKCSAKMCPNCHDGARVHCMTVTTFSTTKRSIPACTSVAVRMCNTQIGCSLGRTAHCSDCSQHIHTGRRQIHSLRCHASTASDTHTADLLVYEHESVQTRAATARTERAKEMAIQFVDSPKIATSTRFHMVAPNQFVACPPMCMSEILSANIVDRDAPNLLHLTSRTSWNSRVTLHVHAVQSLHKSEPRQLCQLQFVSPAFPFGRRALTKHRGKTADGCSPTADDSSRVSSETCCPVLHCCYYSYACSQHDSEAQSIGNQPLSHAESRHAVGDDCSSLLAVALASERALAAKLVTARRVHTGDPNGPGTLCQVLPKTTRSICACACRLPDTIEYSRLMPNEATHELHVFKAPNRQKQHTYGKRRIHSIVHAVRYQYPAIEHNCMSRMSFISSGGDRTRM